MGDFELGILRPQLYSRMACGKRYGKPARDGDAAGSSSRGGCWGSLISRPIGEGEEAVIRT